MYVSNDQFAMQIYSPETEMEWKLPWLTLEQAMIRDTTQLKRYVNEYESDLLFSSSSNFPSSSSSLSSGTLSSLYQTFNPKSSP